MRKEYKPEEEMKWILRAKTGDKKAMMILIQQYEPLMRKLTAGETRMDWEDLRQDLILSFLEGVRDFDKEKKVYFPYYIRQKLYWKKNHIITGEANRQSREIHCLEEMKDRAEEKTTDQDLPAVLNAIASGLPEEERNLLDALLKGEERKTIMEKTGKSRASYYRLRARLFTALRKGLAEMT